MYRYCQSNCPFLSPLVSRLDVWPQAQPHSCPMFRPIARFCQCSNVAPMFVPNVPILPPIIRETKQFANCVILRMLQQNQRIKTLKEQESVAASTTLIFFPRLTIRLRFFLSRFLLRSCYYGLCVTRILLLIVNPIVSPILQ